MVPTAPLTPGVSIAAAQPALMRPMFECIEFPSRELTPLGAAKPAIQPAGWGTRDPSGFTPAQLLGAYGPNGIGDGTGQTIAIVDAYDDPALLDSTASGFPGSRPGEV